MNSVATIADMVHAAEKHADDMSKDRLRAIEYYQGEMKDTPADQGRSQMVSRVVRAQIKKVMPSLRRTLLGSDIIAEFQPAQEGDEPGAAQATDYINGPIVDECDIRRHIEDAMHDAALLRNGILRWWWDEQACSKTSKHSGLTEDAFAELVASDEVEVLEHTEREEVIEIEGAAIPVAVHDVKIKRNTVMRRVKVSCVPRERFLIHPDAITLADSLLTGEKMRLTRSDLVAMGYDKEVIDGLSQAEDDEEERDTRRDHITVNDEPHRANEMLDYYDIYVRYDMDGDGISELRHMCFAGGLGENNLLHDEECDEVQYADIKLLSQPHQWEGISLADDLMDLQRAETVILRQTLDNIYWQNNPQPIYQAGAVQNPDAVVNPEFGLGIKVREGVSVRDAIGTNQIPFVATQSFGMLEYLGQEAEDRTGVSDASAGLDADALQNMTATASNMVNNAGIGQTELMVSTAAEGLRAFFGGLLRLIIRHQDIPRTVRLRDEWVEVDPRHWNAEMDADINVGLGAGTRERDMQVMQFVMMMQEKLLAAYGPDNPFVKPDNLWEALSKSVEAAGLKTPDLYFTEPDPEEIAAMMEAMRSAPDPETVKMQGQMQLEQMKLQGNMEMKKMDVQVQRDKEAAQMEADIVVERERLAAKAKEAEMQAEIDALKEGQKLAFEREKLASSEQLKREEMSFKARVEIAKMQGDSDEIENAAGGLPDMPATTREVVEAAMQTFAEYMHAIDAKSRQSRTILRGDNKEIIGSLSDDGTRHMVVRDADGEAIGVEVVQ